MILTDIFGFAFPCVQFTNQFYPPIIDKHRIIYSLYCDALHICLPNDLVRYSQTYWVVFSLR